MGVLALGFRIVLFLVLFAILVYKFLRTRDPGLLWLMVPLLVAPVLDLLLNPALQAAVNALSAGRRVGIFPFTLVESERMSLGQFLAAFTTVKQVIWQVLIILGVAFLHTGKRRGEEGTA